MRIILIGMPGVGKTTIGKHVAEKLSYNFVDTDRLIEEGEQSRIQCLVNEGVETFKRVECGYITIFCTNETTNRVVVSTGGSVIYENRTMRTLRRYGTVIYLYARYRIFEERRSEIARRVLIKDPEMTLRDLFVERDPLYRQWAHNEVSAEGTVDEVADRVIQSVSDDL